MDVKEFSGQSLSINYNHTTVWLFIILFLFLPFIFLPNSLELHFIAKNAFLTIIVSALTFLSFFQILRGNKVCYRTPLDIPFFLFLLLSFISLPGAVNTFEALKTIQMFLILIVFYYITAYFFPLKKLDTIFSVLIHSAFLISLIAVWQALNAEDFTLQQTVTSTFGHSNLLAQYLIAVFPISLCRNIELKRTRSIIYLLETPVIFSAIILTYCRGAWVGGVVSISLIFILFFTCWEIRKYFSIKSFLFIVIALLLIAIPIVLKNTGVIKSLIINNHKVIIDDKNTPYAEKSKIRTLEQRKEIWSSTIKMINDHPLFGVGAGNFKIMVPKYRTPEESSGKGTIIKWAHNDILEIAAEAGIPSAIVFCSIIIISFVIFFKKRNHYGENSVVMLPLAASVMATFVHAQSSFNIHQTVPACLFFFSLGIICNFEKKLSVESRKYYGLKKIDYLLSCVFLLISTTFFIKPVIAEWYYTKAASASKEENWKDCQKFVKKSINYNKKEAKYYYTAGLSSYGLSKYHLAAKYANKAGRLTPYVIAVSKLQAFSFNELGNKKYKIERYGKAAHYYRNAIKSLEKIFTLPVSSKKMESFSSFTGIAYYNMGNCLIKKGDFKGAETAFKTSLKYIPDYKLALIKLKKLQL